jgi:hypothetical protein
LVGYVGPAGLDAQIKEFCFRYLRNTNDGTISTVIEHSAEKLVAFFPNRAHGGAGGRTGIADVKDCWGRGAPVWAEDLS